MIVTETATEVVKPAPQPIPQADRPVALIVDDDPDTRERMALLLEHDGWSVRQARDGERALLLAREHVPEVIVLDLALPTLSGLDVLRILKSWTDQPTRVVVVSAFAMLMALPDLRLADSTVQKPFSAGELLAQVNRTARRQRPRPAIASGTDEVEVHRDAGRASTGEGGARDALTRRPPTSGGYPQFARLHAPGANTSGGS
jgi:DNA-binding response OmpR family regulator